MNTEIHVDGVLVVIAEYSNGLLIAIPEFGKCVGGSSADDVFFNKLKLEEVGIESEFAERIAKAISA